MKTLYEIRKVNTRDNGTRLDGYYNAEKYVEHNGKKFRFICRTENGDPCGFKSNKCIKIMTSDGNFVNLIDCFGVGCPYNNNYYESVREQDNYCKGLFEAFEHYIEMVY